MSAETPMRCATAGPYLSAYVDGELAEPLRTQVERHIAACGACAAKVARYAAIDQKLGQLPPSAPKPGTLDAILAAVEERRPEPATRERLREGITLRDVRRRLSTLDFPAHDAEPPIPQARRRTLVLAGALPAIAAALIITVTLVAFIQMSGNRGYYVSGAPTPTPAPGRVTLERTQASVAAYRSQLSFDPVLPRFLPDGATLARIAVGPASAGATGRSLDIVWTLSGDVRQMRLRETPGNAGVPEYSPGGLDLALSWQIGDYPWRPLVPDARTEEPRIAVGQQRARVSIALEVPVPPGANGTVDAQGILRITALSMDRSFNFVTVKPAQTDGRIIHFKAAARDRTGQPAWGVEVYETSDGSRARVRVVDAAGTTIYTDILDGGGGIRLDERQRLFSTFSGAPDAALTEATGPLTTNLFRFANTLEQHGELWNMGETTYNGQRVWDLRLVNAPSLTHVYVSTATQQVIAVVVDDAAGVQPGGPSAAGHYASKSGCLTYTFIEYLDPARVSGAFATQPPRDYQAGATPPSIRCG